MSGSRVSAVVRVAAVRGSTLFAGVVWTVGLLQLALLAVRARDDGVAGADFLAVHYGAFNLAHFGDPYRLVSVTQPFVYPPSAAVLAAPTALLSPPASRSAGVAVVAIAIAALALLSGWIAGGRWSGVVGGIVLCVVPVALPGDIALLLGNLSAVVAAMLAGVVLLGLRERWWAAAILFGLAVALKPLVVPAGLIFLAARRFREVFVAAGIVILLNAVALPFMHDSLRLVLRRFATLMRGGYMRPRGDGAIAIIAQRAHAPAAVADLARLAVAVVGVGICVLVWRRAEPLRSVTLAAVPILSVALCSRIDEDHFSLVAVPLVTFMAAHLRTKLGLALTGTAVAVIGMRHAIPPISRDWVGRQAGVGQVLLLLAVAVTLAVEHLRSGGPAAVA